MVGARIALAIILALVTLQPALGRQQDASGGGEERGEEPAVTEREELLREARRAKMRDLDQPKQSRLERWIARAQELTGQQDDTRALWGFSPVLGGLKSGAGLLRGGIRWSAALSDDDRFLTVEALISNRLYWGVEAHAGVTWAGESTHTFGRYWHLPGEDFFGVGPSTDRADRAGYRHDQLHLGGLAAHQLTPRLLMGGQITYEHNRIGRGLDDDIPPVDEVFTNLAIPGLDSGADYVLTGAFVEFDGREMPSPIRPVWRYSPTAWSRRGLAPEARSGHYASAQLVRFNGIAGLGEGFTRVDMEAQHFFALRRGMQTVALREWIALTTGPVPFYRMPALGGVRNLRGFTEQRFRGENALSLTAEYRYHIWWFAEAALFVDAGQVFGQIQDLRADHLEWGYGAGLRLFTGSGLLDQADRLLARVDVARSRDGFEAYLTLHATL